MNASDIVQIIEAVKRSRQAKVNAALRLFVKQSGGWSKAFPDKHAHVEPFDLSQKSGPWCLDELRMLSGDIQILRKQLGIPQMFRTANRDTASGVDALCMLLYKLSGPRKYCHLRATFGGSAARIARIANSLAVYLYNRFKDKLESLDRERLTDAYLMEMARAQYRKNGIMQNVVGFIDATVRPCCRLAALTPFMLFSILLYPSPGLFTFKRKCITARIVFTR